MRHQVDDSTINLKCRYTYIILSILILNFIHIFSVSILDEHVLNRIDHETSTLNMYFHVIVFLHVYKVYIDKSKKKEIGRFDMQDVIY